MQQSHSPCRQSLPAFSLNVTNAARRDREPKESPCGGLSVSCCFLTAAACFCHRFEVWAPNLGPYLFLPCLGGV